MKLLAFDQSMRGFAYAALPVNWNGDWDLLSTGVFDGGPVPRKSADHQIWARTYSVFEYARARLFLCDADLVGFESYGYSANPQLDVVECVGALKLELERTRVDFCTVNQGSARKLLLGKVPRKGAEAKAAVRAAIEAAGGPPLSLDECDAFCVLNFMLSNQGGFCFAQA